MDFWGTRLGRYIDDKRTQRLIEEYYGNTGVDVSKNVITIRCPCCSHGLKTEEKDIYSCPDCGIVYKYNAVMELAGAQCPRCNHITWQYSETELSRCEKCTTSFIVYTEDGFKQNGFEVNKATPTPAITLDECYIILGCNKTTPFEEVTKKYHKLAKIFHPDMLASKDVPPEILRLTSDKFVDVKYAYEKIRDVVEST